MFLIDKKRKFIYIYSLKNKSYKQKKKQFMKKILFLLSIVVLASCGTEKTTETNSSDSTMVDSTIVTDSISTDSAMTEDTTSVTETK